MTTNDYLDAVKMRLSIDSDYRLSKVFGCHTSAISNYRNARSHLCEETAIKVAEILKIDPGQVLADVAAERTKCPAAKAAWEAAARRLSGAAAAVFMSVIIGLGATPHPAQAGSIVAGKYPYEPPRLYIMSNRLLVKKMAKLAIFWLWRLLRKKTPEKKFTNFSLSAPIL